MMPTAIGSGFERDSADRVTGGLLAQLDSQPFGYSTDFIKLFEELGAALEPGDAEN